MLAWRVECGAAMIDDELDVGKTLHVLRQVRNPAGAGDEHRQAMGARGLQKPIVTALFEQRALGRGKDRGAQRP